uniref:Cyclin-dependent protein kinase inhibitor SMR6 n=1 Tax=Davidia involucrata TaxID=16924 RepID=A0A5B7C442_DAVIN
MDGGVVESESEGKKWVLAGIPLRTPLKLICTNPVDNKERENEDDEECSTTPTAKEARIPTRLSCPPPPRKQKPSSSCHYNGVREFFTPPDLETVFIRRVQT